MKEHFIVLNFFILFIVHAAFARTHCKEHKPGHIFQISVLDYFSKISGIKDANFQFKNEEEDSSVLVIDDTNGSLILAQWRFTSLTYICEQLRMDFLLNANDRNTSTIVFQTKGELKLIQCDGSFYDNELKTDFPKIYFSLKN